MIEARIEGRKVVETPETHIAPVIDIMEALKKSLEMRKPPMVAQTADGSAEEAEAEAVSEAESGQPKRKRAPRKVKTA
jgi:non-homologous end joining protein Ku